MKRIGVLTSTRADYGILKNVIGAINDDDELELNLFVTGTHLSPEHGMTIREIEEDGYPIKEKVRILVQSGDPNGVSKTMGMAAILFADVFERNQIDILVVLGDRYELLPIVAVAGNYNIPVAHISGGETTEGAVDEYVRHCLTKMSFIHFPACEEYRRRIIQLGENPDRVFNVGDVGVEAIKRIEEIDLDDLSKSVGIDLNLPYFCVTFHPVTREFKEALDQVNELLDALDYFPNYNFVFTKANADAGGAEINKRLEKYVSQRDNCVLHSSLGIRKYVNLMRHAKGIIGNSSSGIVEAPTLRIPTINIGNRQKGRLKANSIIDCEPNKKSISHGIKIVTSADFRKIMENVISPYEGDDSSKQIVLTIKEFLSKEIQLEKKFYDVEYRI